MENPYSAPRHRKAAIATPRASAATANIIVWGLLVIGVLFVQSRFLALAERLWDSLPLITQLVFSPPLPLVLSVSAVATSAAILNINPRYRRLLLVLSLVTAGLLLLALVAGVLPITRGIRDLT